MNDTGLLQTSPTVVGAPRQRRSLLVVLFGIDPAEAHIETRGFPMTPAQPALEAAGSSFVDGYNLALIAQPTEIDAALTARPSHLRGFFAEGAAMGAAIAGLVRPWNNQLPALFDQIGDRYVHLLHVGVGWAIARAPFAQRKFMRPLDPLLAWLAVDGRGFHDGYFHAAKVARGWRAVSDPSAAIYDQGVGRSLWFSCGADAERIAATIAALPPDRAGDLWAGVGLATTYAGGATVDTFDGLVPDPERRWLKQGAAFAVTAHARACAPPPYATATVERITGIDWPTVTHLVADAEAAARSTGKPSVAQYQLWRSLIADFIDQRSA